MASTLKLVVLLSVAIGLLVTTTNVMADQDNTKTPATVKLVEKECEGESELCIPNILIQEKSEILQTEIGGLNEKK
uniref:Uncharacterized protein n=1 Tax=Octopus bimaculoides TaxID=37653 RepID=A0A0L8FMF4_OCTBM